MHIVLFFMRIFAGLTSALLCFLVCVVGVVAVFSSFFFEEMNASAWLEHILVFFGGMIGVSLGLGCLFLLATRGFFVLGREE